MGQLWQHRGGAQGALASARKAGLTWDQFRQKLEAGGWSVDPRIEQDISSIQQNDPTNQALGGVPTSIEQQQGMQALNLGRYAAEQDPIRQPLMDSEASNLAELNPETYNQYANQIGGIRSGVDPNQQQWGADQYRRLASGQDSVVARQTQLARDQLARDAASQVASARGGYNPALARSAIMARTQGNADLGAQGAIGQAQERQAALQGYMGAQGQTDELRRGLADDQSRRVGQQAAMSGMADQTAHGLLGMRQGLDQRYADNYLRSLGQEYSARTPQVQQPGFAENLLGFGGSVLGTAFPWFNMFMENNKGGK